MIAKALSGRAVALAALALAIVYPLVVPNDYFIYVMALAFIYAIATIGLNLILGYTGQLNLAHAGFMAIGAYTLGILTVDYGVPFWLAFFLSGLVAAAFGFLAGLVSLRLKADYFAIFTLCVGLIIWLVIEKWDALTHGVVGIIGIPAPSPIGPLRFETPLANYYLVLAVLALSLFLMDRIVHSLLGRAFIAIRSGEGLAEALGIPLMRTKVTAFVISTAYAGYAGGLYAGFVRFIGPQIASEANAFDMIAFILVGGLGTLSGPVLGAVALTWATQSLQFLQDYRLLVFGPLLILLVMFLPRGIIGTLKARQARQAGAKAAAERAAAVQRSAAAAEADRTPAHA
ncbi:branched-chain amino acid ABC transporter permease [Enterovirga aerilata]|uniref:Branched-chain amino acid ABC transporter permease n=1 Tax=Enterovirga aerilata TaxID=2730920 RepID=A0A849IBB9_9HYPH|nr:branched-chain amino acid ABC transporter permease [Enterovirga sp. DB1703]NNM74698.1 branched-chain amino acid ABC transporter permease [Enterovirga sp. DB1703]